MKSWCHPWFFSSPTITWVLVVLVVSSLAEWSNPGVYHFYLHWHDHLPCLSNGGFKNGRDLLKIRASYPSMWSLETGMACFPFATIRGSSRYNSTITPGCSWCYQLYLMDFFFMPVTRSENFPNADCSVSLKSLDWMKYYSIYVKGRLTKKPHLGCGSEGHLLALRFVSGCWLTK